MIRRPPRSTLFPSTTLSRSLKSAQERRTDRRFNVQLPLHFRVSQRTSSSRWGVGITTDMSSGGLSFRCRRAIPVGSHVELRSEEHTSELQSQSNLVCRLLLE